MILRLSQKLNARVKGVTLGTLPPHENPLLDWSAQAFAVGRAEYVLLSNTQTLYSAVLDGTGVAGVARFTELALGGIRSMLVEAGGRSLPPPRRPRNGVGAVGQGPGPFRDGFDERADRPRRCSQMMVFQLSRSACG